MGDIPDENQGNPLEPPAPNQNGRNIRNISRIVVRIPDIAVARTIPAQCPICLCPDYSHQPRATLCGHVYCGPCLEQTLIFRPMCPICRTDQEYSSSIPLYF